MAYGPALGISARAPLILIALLWPLLLPVVQHARVLPVRSSSATHISTSTGVLQRTYGGRPVNAASRSYS